MSKLEGTGKSGASSFWSSFAMGVIVSAALYYFDPCRCQLVAHHARWLVDAVGEPPVCIGAGTIAYLINRWLVHKPGDALFACGFVVVSYLCGALGYWLSGNWLVAMLFGGCPFVALLLIGATVDSNDSDNNDSNKKTAEGSPEGPTPEKDSCTQSDPDNGGEAARLAACAVGIALSLPNPQ
jgi:hypothetical protein